MDDFNKAIELNNGQADAHFNRGNLHAKLENGQAAIADYQKVRGLYSEQGKKSGYLRATMMMIALQRQLAPTAVIK